MKETDQPGKTRESPRCHNSPPISIAHINEVHPPRRMRIRYHCEVPVPVSTSIAISDRHDRWSSGWCCIAKNACSGRHLLTVTQAHAHCQSRVDVPIAAETSVFTAYACFGSRSYSPVLSSCQYSERRQPLSMASMLISLEYRPCGSNSPHVSDTHPGTHVVS